MLSSVQKAFMEIVECSMEGKKREKLNITGPEQITELMDMAKEQHMLPMVYDVIAHADCGRECTEIINRYKVQAVVLMMQQTQRAKMFFKIYNVLLEKGIKPIVVKGAVIRSMYKNPDCRCSNDEDILIEKSEFFKCHEILIEEGYECETKYHILKENIPYEVAYFNRSTKLRIEIHTALLPENSNAFEGLNRQLKGIFESAQLKNIGPGEVWTLSDTQHFLFLLSHSYKHFVYCGFGIRQLCDLLMMAEKCRKTIDWDYIEKSAAENRIYRFLINLIDIGEQYLGFDGNRLPLRYKQKIKPDSGNLLEDMLQAGVFGKSNAGRIHSANITMNAVHKSFIHKNVRLSVVNSVFPSLSYMKQNFSYLNKNIYLLPLAYCQRLAAYLRERKIRAAYGEPVDSITVGRKRIALMRQYGII